MSLTPFTFHSWVKWGSGGGDRITHNKGNFKESMLIKIDLSERIIRTIYTRCVQKEAIFFIRLLPYLQFNGICLRNTWPFHTWFSYLFILQFIESCSEGQTAGYKRRFPLYSQFLKLSGCISPLAKCQQGPNLEVRTPGKGVLLPATRSVMWASELSRFSIQALFFNAPGFLFPIQLTIWS